MIPIKTSRMVKLHLISALYRRMQAEHLDQVSAAAKYGVPHRRLRFTMSGRSSLDLLLRVADAFGIETTFRVTDNTLRHDR